MGAADRAARVGFPPRRRGPAGTEVVEDRQSQVVVDGTQPWRNLADSKRTGSSVREMLKRAAPRIAREKALTAQRQAHDRAAKAFARGQLILT